MRVNPFERPFDEGQPPLGYARMSGLGQIDEARPRISYPASSCLLTPASAAKAFSGPITITLITITTAITKVTIIFFISDFTVTKTDVS